MDNKLEPQPRQKEVQATVDAVYVCRPKRQLLQLLANGDGGDALYGTLLVSASGCENGTSSSTSDDSDGHGDDDDDEPLNFSDTTASDMRHYRGLRRRASASRAVHRKASTCTRRIVVGGKE
jgi:hypothetical protein